MAIKDLQAKQGQVDLIAEIIEKGDVREFNKFGKAGRVCNSVIKDETGKITLTLWNEQIDKVNVGDKVHVINGYVSEWQGEKQISTGRFGQLEVIGKADETQEETKDEEETIVRTNKPAEADKEDDLSGEEPDESGEDFIKDEEEIE